MRSKDCSMVVVRDIDRNYGDRDCKTMRVDEFTESLRFRV